LKKTCFQGREQGDGSSAAINSPEGGEFGRWKRSGGKN